MTDDTLPLGPPIRPTPAPAQPVQIRPGIWQDPDGKLRTELPTPPAPMPFIDWAHVDMMMRDRP